MPAIPFGAEVRGSERRLAAAVDLLEWSGGVATVTVTRDDPFFVHDIGSCSWL
jgi:hypothetical protein